MRATAMAVAVAIAAMASALVLQGNDRVAELDRLRAASADGVVQLQDSTLASLLPSPPPAEIYLLVVDSRAAIAAAYKGEFSSVSYSFSRNHGGSTAVIFFASVEVPESPLAIHRFNLTAAQIPCVVYLDPGGGSEVLPRSSSATAQQLALFIRAKSGVEIGQIVSPPLLTTIQLACLVAIVAGASPIVYRAIASSTILCEPKLWCGAAITLYLFVVSGGIFSILYDVPVIHPESGAVFYGQPNWQFAGEGLVVAATYGVPAAAISVMTHLVPRSKGGSAAKLPALVIMAVASCCALGWLSSLNAWKTGR